MHYTRLHDDPAKCPKCGHDHQVGTACEVCDRWTKLGGRMACGPEVTHGR